MTCTLAPGRHLRAWRGMSARLLVSGDLSSGALVRLLPSLSSQCGVVHACFHRGAGWCLRSGLSSIPSPKASSQSVAPLQRIERCDARCTASDLDLASMETH